MKFDDRKDTSTCPECGSEHIEGGSIIVEGDACYQGMTCNMCFARWGDIYHFAGHIDEKDNIRYRNEAV